MQRLTIFWLLVLTLVVSGCSEEGEPVATEDKPPRTGEEVFQQSCARCHVSGAMGAPRLADQAEWEKRIEKGRQTLLNSAINGYRGMPPHGGCRDCTHEETSNAVYWILEQNGL